MSCLLVGLSVVGLDVGVSVGLDVVWKAVGLLVGVSVVGLDVGISVGLDDVGKAVGLLVGLFVLGLDIGVSVGLDVVGLDVGDSIDALMQFSALGGAQLAYVPWQHSSLLAK
jgi:hypothetical protein